MDNRRRIIIYKLRIIEIGNLLSRDRKLFIRDSKIEISNNVKRTN
jgi:hypothetical protein